VCVASEPRVCVIAHTLGRFAPRGYVERHLLVKSIEECGEAKAFSPFTNM
jgi:hypothetical protein